MTIALTVVFLLAPLGGTAAGSEANSSSDLLSLSLAMEALTETINV